MKKVVVLLVLSIYMMISYMANVQAQNDTTKIVGNNTNNANIENSSSSNIENSSSSNIENSSSSNIENSSSSNIGNSSSSNIGNSSSSNIGNSSNSSISKNEKNRSKVTIKIYRKQGKSQILEIIFFLSIIMVIIYILKRKDM